ncbi:hypothetical protein HHK36_026549 [Tetracentron sinense]|uniref:SANT domain-containing protein n=1 Tax=Tetracentron sinense TaxID=13715 RepID=A0A835D4Q4_TETSI|nr:hypothetical protein HHK36_026549 [Tetracentron sinense]
MAPTRKSRSVNKRFSNVNDVSPDKDGGNANKSRQRKRKLSDMLGSQWSKEELERFYEAYRKHGKDWKKVAGVVRNRSVEMVEALYTMNRAYLSLPEGTASVAGLIAMMTDHYSILEGSDSERESNDGSGISRKPPKRGRGKFRLNISKGLEGDFPDLLQSQAVASSYGCLSLLKKRRTGGSRPRAVGKRTPRFPVSYSYAKEDREKYLSPNKQGPKSEMDANDDEVAHEVALALAEASQRGGSPQVSQTPNRRTEHMRPSPVRNGERMHAESEISTKLIGTAIDEDCLEGSLGSREAENADYARDTKYLMDREGFGTVEVQRKGKKFHGKKPKVQDFGNNHFDEVREACSGTEEGLNLSALKGKVETEVMDAKIERSSPQGPRKRSKKLLFEDESSALDALQTLADLSLMMPASTIESESSVQFKEEKIDNVDRSCLPEATSSNHQRDKPKSAGAKEKGNNSTFGVEVTASKNAKLGRDSALGVSALPETKHRPYQPTTKMRKRKRKSLVSKLQIPKSEAYSDSHQSEPQKTEASAEEGKKSLSKGKRTSQIASLSKQGKSVRLPERSSSTTDQRRAGNDSAVSTVLVPTVNQVNLPTKLRSRRKMDPQKPLLPKELKSSENIVNDRLNKYSSSLHDRALSLKEKISYCLSSPLVRRWCAFEWFYSAIDYPWFAKREFVEYLNHVGLGHVPRLTRVEWGVIRSSLGKPRRLSEQFLREEKEKLEQYRESVRTHYTELRAGIREGLPTDLARPLSVGQRVIALHPKTREIHDGSVLTVDRNRCRVQFDRPELGVEFVMDIDCMPSNPLENMPEALRRQNFTGDKFCENFIEPKVNGQSKDWTNGGHMKLALSENLENTETTSHISPSTHPMNTLFKQAKGNSISAISQAKAAAIEIVNAQQAAYTPAQIQAREADIRALSDLTGALNKKEALVLELRNMNDEVFENQKDGDNSIKDCDPFKKQYATVSSALHYLRQRNTYQGNPPPPWLKPIASSGGPPSCFDHSAFHTQESGSHIVEIFESSKTKAQTMVDAATQAMSSLKEGEDAFTRIGEVLDSVNNRHFGADSAVSAMRSFTHPDPVHGSLAYHDQSTSCISEPMTTDHAPGPKLNDASAQNEAQLISELISSCVATLFMIQTCTERQYPPADVAQILDSATTTLHPNCPQNLPIYREIQMCMGIIKTQILALIPT